MAKNPVTKRGLYRQMEPDPRVYELSTMIFNSGLTFTAIAAKGKLADGTVAKIAYCETRRPAGTTIAGILKGCGWHEEWKGPNGETWQFMPEEDALKKAEKRRSTKGSK